MRALLAVLWLCVGWVGIAHAQDAVEEAQLAELERVRGQVAGQVQLTAYDLVDEMVYGWTQEPVFDKPTPVVLAGVTVPVGLGTGLQGLLENHISSVIAENPATHVQLAHCPQCTALIVHSGPEGTVVSRGFDNPEAMAELGATTGQHALFIDVEAEGSWLVLRARITRLTPELPIVWSHTLTTSAGTPALLRSPNKLKSAAEAREEYLDALRSRGRFLIPVRFGVHTYAHPYSGYYYYYGNQNRSGGTPPPPFLWVQSGVEVAATDARAWTGSFIAGYSFIPQAYQGMMGQVRIGRLLTGRSRSITHPDLYIFGGGAVFSVWGPATASFALEKQTSDEILAAAEPDAPKVRNSFGGLQVGLDLRIGNRVGISSFLETLPSLSRSKNIGNYVRIIGINWQSMGTEATLWF